MKILKFKYIIPFFLIRYLLLLLFCYLTIYITGRLADMNFLLGFESTNRVGGKTTDIAKNTYALIAGWGNSYIIIGIMGIILTFILFFLLRNFIDSNNKNLWQTILLTPGLLIYSNAPTKETLFLYPSIILIIFECNYLIGATSKNIPYSFLKIPIILWLFLARSQIAIPYILFSLLSIILKNIYLGKMKNKLKITKCILYAFSFSIIINFLLPIFFPETINTLSANLGNTLSVKQNIYRPNYFEGFGEPLRFFQNQYLSLFPTIGELIATPYKLIIILDSSLIIFTFIRSWSNLFILINSYKIFRKVIFIIFIFISIVYFSSYGIIGSINLGASQRFRVNFIPLGIFYPLILEKKLRHRKENLYINNQ